MSCSRCERLHDVDPPIGFDPKCEACSGIFPYSTLGMPAAYPLTHVSVEREAVDRRPGSFALGFFDSEVFRVFFIGCDERDVALALHGWVDMPGREASNAAAPWAAGADASSTPGATESAYTHFAFRYADTAVAARSDARRNFDSFGGSTRLDNDAAPGDLPARPDPTLTSATPPRRRH